MQIILKGDENLVLKILKDKSKVRKWWKSKRSQKGRMKKENHLENIVDRRHWIEDVAELGFA